MKTCTHRDLYKTTHTVLMLLMSDGMTFLILSHNGSDKFFPVLHFSYWYSTKNSNSTSKVSFRCHTFYISGTFPSAQVYWVFTIFIFTGSILVKFSLYLKISSIPPKMHFFSYLSIWKSNKRNKKTLGSK